MNTTTTKSSFKKNEIILLFLFMVILQSFGQNYQPPVGIPAPDFGINEQLDDYYTRPVPWDTETPGWYFIDQYNPNASDSYTYGTPNNPRVTIPPSIPAGSVVEINGVYDFAPIGYDVLNCQGTQNAPVFIIGNETTVVLRKWVIKSSFTIIENIEFTNLGKVIFTYPSNDVSLRSCELHNIPGKIGGYGESLSERVHNIIIYNNQIHSQDGWDQNPNVDLDNHAIKFDAYVNNVWIVENVGYHNGGSFIQIGNMYSGDLSRNQYYYIGNNTLYSNRQSPIEIKQSSYIFISENTLFDNYKIQNNSVGQAGIYVMYGPEEIWMINNKIYNSNMGIAFGSNSGGNGQNQYLIGNLIYNIHMPGGFDYNENSAWSPAGIMLAGGQNRYIVNNTIYDVDAGINIPGSGNASITNNIISKTTRANHIFIEVGNTSNSSSLYHNLLYQENDTAKIRWGNSQIIDVATFETTYPSSGNNNFEDNPSFTDETTYDLSLLPNSIAIDNAMISNVYQTFYNQYALDIKKDMEGFSRPQNNLWDIGAFEFETPLSTNTEILNNTPLIYPNPTNSFFTVYLKNETLEKAIIYNQLGQQVKTATTKDIDISNLSNGVYFVKITSQNGKTATKKVIKN